MLDRLDSEPREPKSEVGEERNTIHLTNTCAVGASSIHDFYRITMAVSQFTLYS